MVGNRYTSFVAVVSVSVGVKLYSLVVENRGTAERAASRVHMAMV